MKISIVLAALTGSFETDMNRASKTAQKRMKEIEQTAKKVGAAVGAALVAGAGLAAVAIKQAIDRADELSKTAQKIGITTEALSKLGYAAQLADVDLTTLQGGLSKLTKFQADAANGTEKNIDLFNALGISFKNADGSLRNTEAVFRDLSDVFQALPDGANKSALALDVFGRSGANLIPLLNGGADGLDLMAERAERLGIVVDTQTGKAAEEFNDRLSDLRLQVEGLALQVAADLLPDLNDLVDGFQRGTASGDGFTSTAEDIANAIRGVATVAEGAYRVLDLLVSGFVNITAEMSRFVAQYSLLPGADAAAAFFGNVADIAGARATNSANFFTGNGTDAPRIGTGGDTGITGTGTRGGRGRGAGSAASDAAAEAAIQQQKYNDALKAYRDAQDKATDSSARGTKASKEAAEAAKEAAAARLAQLDQFLELVDLREEERRQMAEDAKALADAKAVVDQTLADIAFETKLLGLNNLEREKAIALRYANVDAASAEGQAISAALDELDRAQQVAEGMDVVRGATEGLFSDLMDGSKSAKDAFKDFVDGILDGIAQIVARNLTESLFGSFGSTGGGASGGLLSSLFGSLFGGARAAGGPMYSGKAYLVGEEGPELVVPQSAGTVIPAGRTAAMLRGGGGNTNITFVLPGRNDIRTEAQRQSDLGRATQRQLGRSTA